MPTVLTKLRRLHEEVCHCWRKQSEPHISEGEAEVLDMGFQVLERLVECLGLSPVDPQCLINIVNNHVNMYCDRVHAQFDSDADIVIKGNQPHE